MEERRSALSSLEEVSRCRRGMKVQCGTLVQWASGLVLAHKLKCQVDLRPNSVHSGVLAKHRWIPTPHVTGPPLGPISML